MLFLLALLVFVACLGRWHTSVGGVINMGCVGGMLAKSAFTCSKLIIETLEQGVKYVQI